MHLGIALIVIFATWRWGDWKNWKVYQGSMFYIASGGLLYEYLTRGHSLWLFHPDFLYNQKITAIVYALITMPLSVLIFLSRYPESKLNKQIRYILVWVCIYASGELILLWTGRISYQKGWHYGYSIVFDIIIFVMLRLHHQKPLRAYGISILIIIIMMLWFHIPMDE